MASKTKEKSDNHSEEEVPTEKKLDDLYKLIDGIETAMFTTRRRDGHLVSRAMQTQHRTAGTDLWFVADIASGKLEELVHDPHVNLSYYNNKSREWVSVSGTAIVSQDKELIRGLWKEDWRAWFAKGDDPRSGTPDDPRIALILVESHSVTYLKQDKPRPVILFEVLKAMVTKTSPNLGSERHLEEHELPVAPAREAR
jgi:general stress protein 26